MQNAKRKDEPKTGVQCPRCGSRWSRVIYRRQNADVVCRRRECNHCGNRFTSRESTAG